MNQKMRHRVGFVIYVGLGGFIIGAFMENPLVAFCSIVVMSAATFVGIRHS